MLVPPRDLGKAFENALLGVADTGDARAVGKAQLRHLAAGRGTIVVYAHQWEHRIVIRWSAIWSSAAEASCGQNTSYFLSL